MRRTLLIALALTIAAFTLAITSSLPSEPTVIAENLPSDDARVEAGETTSPPMIAQDPFGGESGSGSRDAATTVNALVEGRTAPAYSGEVTAGTRELTMSAFLIGAVAAEMPAEFEPEALAAQAVAARTYVLRNMSHRPPRHTENDVCDDPTCCLAYLDDGALRAKWGDAYAANHAKITAAVLATDGVYITYGTEPILAAFHASSAGMTENVATVWGSSEPYLVSVESPETPENVPDLVATVTVSRADFRATVTAALPNAKLPTDDVSAWVTDVARDASGRISSLSLGGVPVTGVELRRMFALRSTAASIEVGEAVVFTTMGYGHGVGMSQRGANLMAAGGASWREILLTYYTGVSLSDEGESA
ncbi:MAG: stage II sporulation protein D [Oscillospiraceae bacterium]|jgi:stage II sporulation protein D|nr:stage II sporulation protein D [Oscillospiraceae bacterium]